MGHSNLLTMEGSNTDRTTSGIETGAGDPDFNAGPFVIRRHRVSSAGDLTSLLGSLCLNDECDDNVVGGGG